MALGPYQSNLLRFLLGQYWQGLERHQRAVRKTRSTVVLSSEIGFMVALSPVVAAVRTSQKRLQKLRQSVTKLRLFLGHSQPNTALLDLSGFDRLLAVSDRLNFQGLKPLLKALQAEKVSPDETVSGIDVVTKSNDSVDKVSLEKVLNAEAAMAQTLLSAGNCLSPKQVNQLTSTSSRWLASVIQGWRLVSSAVLLPVRRISVLWRGSSRDLLNDATGEVKESKAGRIMGIASDLKARSLVLVIDYMRVWNGLTQTQKMKLQQNTNRFIDVKLTEETLQKSRQPTPLKEQRFPISSALVASDSPIALVAQPVLVHSTTAPLISDGVAGSRHSTYVEADVISVDYIEHSLEKLLKWVDRVFFWIEKRWTALQKRFV